MSSAAICFVSTFIAVFALGLQSLNVNQGHYLAAAVTSLMIGSSTIALYKFMPGANAADVAGYLAGGVTGITSSMWFHQRFKAWWTEALARRREARRLREAIQRCRSGQVPPKIPTPSPFWPPTPTNQNKQREKTP
jgi:hypothetical protein